MLHYHFKNKNEEDRRSWEQTRMVCYYALLPHSGKKTIKLTDILEFDWDKKALDSGESKAMTKEDIQQIFKAHKLNGTSRIKGSS